MAVDIGPRIGIDGEAEFRKQLTNINQQLKTLGTEMKAVTSAFDGQDQSADKLVAQNAVLARQIGAQEQALAQLRQGLIQSTVKYGELDTRTLKWQQTVNNATANLNKLKAQLSDNERAMDQASNSSNELADNMDKAGEAASGAGSKFSAVTVAIGNLAANAITAAVSAIGDMISSLINLDQTTEEYRIAQGRLNTAYEAAGLGAETAQQAYRGFYGILGDTDTATEASQLLAQLATNQEEVATWTEIAAGVSGTFGDSLPIESLIEAANETAKVGEVTGTLADALNWVGISEDEFNEKLAACSSESERNQLIMETLSGQYDEATEAFYANNEALVQSRENQAAMDEAMAGLGTTIGNVKNQIMSEFTPSIVQLTQAFNGLLTGAPGAAQQMQTAISGLISTVVQQLPGFINAGTQILTAIVNGIVQNIPQLLAAGLQIVADLLATLQEQLPGMLDTGMQMLDQMVEGILQAIPEMIERLPEVIDGFLGFFDENLPDVLEKGVEILNKLATGIIQAIPDLVAQLPEVITSITGFIGDNLPKLVASGVDLIESLIKGIISAIPSLVANLPKIIDAIGQGIGNLLGGVVEAGREIVRGLWEGISDMAGWIGEKIRSFGDGVLQGIKDFFGIASPSKVFESEVGKYMAQGVGVGFEDEMRRVSGQMQSAIPTPTVETVQNAAAGMVNGLAAANQGVNFPSTIVLTLENGAEIARWLLPYNRMASRANPEVVSGV